MISPFLIHFHPLAFPFVSFKWQKLHADCIYLADILTLIWAGSRRQPNFLLNRKKRKGESLEKGNK